MLQREQSSTHMFILLLLAILATHSYLCTFMEISSTRTLKEWVDFSLTTNLVKTHHTFIVNMRVDSVATF